MKRPFPGFRQVKKLQEQTEVLALLQEPEQQLVETYTHFEPLAFSVLV